MTKIAGLNQLKRDLIKPWLPSQYAKLLEDSSNMLFEEFISDKVENL